ncbi:MAG: two-component system, OmpR family, sensor histidine kinase KdpD, partial [Micromonosporaceae bacterium]
MTSLLTTPRSHARAWSAVGVGVAGLVIVTALLTPHRSLTNAALLYLVPVVAVAVLGGVRLGLATAVASDLLLNWFFVPPYHTFAVERRDNLLALLVYVLVAVTVSVAVDLAARQRAAAVRSGIEARLLARITATPAAEQSLTQLLGHVRDTFGMRWVALLEDAEVVASVGSPTGETPSLRVPAAPNLTMVAAGPELFGEDRRLLGRLAAAAARTLEGQRLARGAARAEQLAEIDRLRTAILAAVGHDLRTPLASIKASASSLRAADVAFSAEDSDELLATIEESGDRLSDLVENLLAMSRLQAGVLSVQLRPLALDEVVARALLHGRDTQAVEVAVADDLPLVQADPGLLERVVANLVSNAVQAAPGGAVTVRAEAAGSQVLLKIIDHGTGIPVADRERVFAPFQRLDDRTADGGLGLGLAIARGFTEAMAGTVTPHDTPGGGLTMTVTLPTP